jgi:transcriptional regulator with XRE-family HTH domain
MDMTIGEKIKRLRKEKGMTQEELGSLIGVQKAAINKYETGIVINLKRDIIAKLASALDVNPVWLMDENDGWPPVPSTQVLIARAIEQDTNRRVIPIVVPDTERFVKLVHYMPQDEYLMVMEAFDKAAKRMKEDEEKNK